MSRRSTISEPTAVLVETTPKVVATKTHSDPQIIGAKADTKPTLQEIQIKYYSEGPEAARTAEYIEDPKKELAKPTKSKSIPPEEPVSRDVYVKRFEQLATRFARLREEETTTKTNFTSRRVRRCDGCRQVRLETREEAKARQFMEWYFNWERDRQAGLVSKEAPYYDTDDEDDEDFFLRTDDYQDISEFQRRIMDFYIRNKILFKTIKHAIQLFIFVVFFVFLLSLSANYDQEQQLLRMTLEGQKNNASQEPAYEDDDEE